MDVGKDVGDAVGGREGKAEGCDDGKREGFSSRWIVAAFVVCEELLSSEFMLRSLSL